MTLERELGNLCRWAPLPPGWSIPELFTECVTIAGRPIHCVGLSARHDRGQLVYGSAAELAQPMLGRAYFELLERAVTLDALNAPQPEYDVCDASGRVIGQARADQVFPRSPESGPWRYARSNGVAAHTNFMDARTSARLELFERDAVLRSWFGGPAPRSQPLAAEWIPPEFRELYAIEVFSLMPRPSEASAASAAIAAGVVLFPHREELPLAYGFAARFTLESAIRSAARECLQALAFLWGEPLPNAVPTPCCDPAFHQDHYLHPSQHDRLRAWIRGSHAGRQQWLLSEPEPGPVGFVDLTPSSLRARLRVVKALPAGELPLTFGLGHPCVSGSIPDEMLVHPIA